jgi:electron transfer flavoprotein alpha subunit
MPKNIWVLPELTSDGETSKLSLGLLTESRDIAAKVGGAVTAIAFGDKYRDSSEVLGRYGVSRFYFFKDLLLEHFSAEAVAAALLPKIHEKKPWLFLMGDTTAGRELAPRLAALLNTSRKNPCFTALSTPASSGRRSLWRPTAPLWSPWIQPYLISGNLLRLLT